MDKKKYMKDAIIASKEIVALKRIRIELSHIVLRLESFKASTVHISLADAEILQRITGLQFFITSRIKIVAKDVPFFPEVTHFTQKEIDKGYLIVEVPFGDDQEAFDEDGELTYKFLKYALVLHNGKVIPYEGEEKPFLEKLILHDAKPV